MVKNKSSALELLQLAPGFYWLSIEEPNLRLLCGVPPDAMKYLSAKDMISSYQINGVYTEHGPNSLLLNENLYVNDVVANLSEFPVLQMFYMQGMGLSFHPNFKKERPLIIGTEKQVQSQLSYINYGNNGLSYMEMIASKLDVAIIDLWFYIKSRFAGDVDLRELIDYLVIKANNPLEIKPGVMLERKDKNQYQISYKNQTVEIDLNLPDKQRYKPTYKLKKCKLPKAKFAVVNTGTGDGWNAKHPCFGSMIIHKNEPYLVDCEVFMQDSLECLSLKQEDLKGIFMTHAHDDHMSGLPVFYKKGKPVTIYATKLIYYSLMHKIMTLLNISEKDYKKVFKHHQLNYEVWNNINGLEVMPLHSAHPIETSIFFFREKDKDDYKTYAHLGDIAPIEIIKKFRALSITDLDRNFYNSMIKNYLTPVNLKKIDVGGGMIHGLVGDFENDASDKIILGHYHRKLSAKELSIGEEQKFGDYDILIP